MEKERIIIGTRGSKLALWQAYHTKDRLEDMGVAVELKIIKTKGDLIQHLSFDKMEGKGFFTKEIESSLLAGEIDLAVHSMKDLPTTHPEGLRVVAVSYRENPSDTLLIQPDALDPSAPLRLKKEAVVGTSSARRKAQLLDFRPDLQIKDIRGNVPTRIQKLRDGNFDAIMLATAGLTRLELEVEPEFHRLEMNPKEFIPAPAQGVLAYQIREGDKATKYWVKQLHEDLVVRRTNVERKVLRLFDGGCQMPLGVYCEQDKMGNYHVWAAKADAWNAAVQRVRLSASSHHKLAERVHEALMATNKDA